MKMPTRGTRDRLQYVCSRVISFCMVAPRTTHSHAEYPQLMDEGHFQAFPRYLATAHSADRFSALTYYFVSAVALADCAPIDLVNLSQQIHCAAAATRNDVLKNDVGTCIWKYKRKRETIS